MIAAAAAAAAAADAAEEYILTTMATEAEEPRVQDAAMSLWALGRSRSRSNGPNVSGDDAAGSGRPNQNATLSSYVPAHGGDGTADAPPLRPEGTDLDLDPRRRIPNAMPSLSLPSLAPSSAGTEAPPLRPNAVPSLPRPLPPLSAGAAHPRPNKTKVAPKKARPASAAKHGAATRPLALVGGIMPFVGSYAGIQYMPTQELNIPPTLPTKSKAKGPARPRDPKRDTSVPFDEMKRLMRVYGSLKCLRNRSLAGTAKPESVKRKFYRWFPDLEERFVRTPGGWYKPKAGHEEEMRRREAMRKADQACLVKKRNTKRSLKKLSIPQAEV